MSSTAAEEKKWLVKSSGVILGPLTLLEVVADIKSRKIAMIDEIRSPETRWKFIREHDELTEAIDSARNDQADSREDTATTFIEGLTSKEEELTPAPFKTDEFSQEPDSSEESDKIVVPEKVISPVTVAKIDPKFTRKPQSVQTEGSNWPIYVLLLMLVGLIGYAVTQFYPKPEMARSLGYEDFLKLARSNKNLGNYGKALEFYRKAESLQKLDVPNRLSMNALLMEVENQNILARQNLESLLSTPNLNNKLKFEIQSLIALSYLRESQLSEAQRRYSELLKTTSSEEAQINLVEIQILQGEFESARDASSTAMRNGVKDPILMLYRSLATYRAEDNHEKLEEVLQDLKRFFARYQDYHAEVTLLQAAVLKKLNKDLDSGDAMRRLLTMDPDLTNEHLHNLSVHREVMGWGYLGNICEILIDSSAESATHKGFEIYCSYEKGELKQALEKVEKARTRFSNDLSLLGLHAFLLYRAGRGNEARAVLQLPRAGESELGQIVRARMCQAQKDWNCAENEWKKIRLRDSQNVAALAGLGKVALGRGQIELANDYLKQGLIISENYVPLLQLKDDLNAH